MFIFIIVALAAQYLGQRSEEVVKSLPVEFSQSQYGDKSERSSSVNKSTRKKRTKGVSGAGSGDEETGIETKSKDSEEKKHKKKKKKKKGDGKFLPKITVRDLVNMLEPQLFNDDDTGTKMVMQEDVARSSIAKHKKEKSRNTDSPKKLQTTPNVSKVVEGKLTLCQRAYISLKLHTLKWFRTMHSFYNKSFTLATFVQNMIQSWLDRCFITAKEPERIEVLCKCSGCDQLCVSIL